MSISQKISVKSALKKLDIMFTTNECFTASFIVSGMKPSDLRTATVRYVGQLDQEGGEHMLFVGLHMDDPGMYD